MEYFNKITDKPGDELLWNIPERKQGLVNIIGGNGQSFRTPVKIAEFLGVKYPINTVNVVLPDALNNKLPTLPNFIFLPSTDSGSFSGEGLEKALNSADFNLIIGDISKNTITAKAVAGAVRIAEKMTLVTRDAVDIIAEENPERALMNENLILFASMPQLIKLFRAVYYPKMLLLNQSLMQVADILHKFTLSYPISIITLHNEQILLATNGNVVTVPLEKSGFSPLTIWGGELAAKILAINLFNPNNFIDASVTAIFSA